MGHVFICYDREDRDFAEVVQAKIERAGHETSMDFDILSAGDDWQDRLDDAIRRSDALVVIMTPAARESDYVAYEWAFALGAAVKVIPIELKKTIFSPRLDTLHRLDFTEGARPWDTLLAEVQKADAARPRTTLAVPPTAPPAIRSAVRAIDSLDLTERSAAIRTLGQMSHPVAHDVLERALEHPVRDVRIAAACYFHDPTDVRTVPGLIAAYAEDHGSPTPRWFPGTWLRDRLGRVGPAAVPPLLDALPAVQEPWVRDELLGALYDVADAAAVPALLELLAHEDPQLRRAAAETLGRIGDQRAIPGLLHTLDDDAVDIRMAAVESLGRLRATAAVPALLAVLENDTRSAQAAAAAALGAIGDRAAVPALITALVEDDYTVRAQAANALAALGDPVAIPQLRAVLAQASDTPDHTTDPIGAVMAALARLGDTASFETLEQRLIANRSGSFGTFEQTLRNMAAAGAAGTAGVIRVLQNAASSTIRDRAARVLSGIDSPEAAAAVKQWRRTRP